MKMNRTTTIIGLCATLLMSACEPRKTSDQVQSKQQEQLLKEGSSQVGMPAIKNFRERKLVKDILEMRDKEITTFTYLWSEVTGKKTFFCNSIGFGVPYATQFTNPLQTVGGYDHASVVAQADPNGLFSPASAEGTWVLCKDPRGSDVKPVYVEPRVIVTPFEMADVAEAPAEKSTKATK